MNMRTYNGISYEAWYYSQLQPALDVKDNMVVTGLGKMELLPVLAANPIKYSSLFVRINLKSWRYVSNLIHISTCHLTGNSIDRPKYITFCHS